MAKISGEILINRPVQQAFDFVADQRNEPIYNPRMLRSEKITDGPIGIGTRFRATARSGRRVVEMLIEVTEYDRARRFGLADHNALCRHQWRVDLRARPWGESDELVLASAPKRAAAAAQSPGRPPWAASRTKDLDRAQEPPGGIWLGRCLNRVVIKDLLDDLHRVMGWAAD